MAIILNHPVINDRLATIRDAKSTMREFRRALKEVSTLMLYTVTSELPTQTKIVETPITVCECQILRKHPVIVPVLRAGASMAEVVSDILGEAPVAWLGLARDEETHKPTPYLNKLPQFESDTPVIITDPMLATGGSLIYSIDACKQKGAMNITVMCLVACPEGVNAIEKLHPDVRIVAAACDSHLNENAYIVPGLGDAGDRLYGA